MAPLTTEMIEGTGDDERRHDSSWLQTCTRVVLVLVALFAFGAVFAGQIFERRGTELGEEPFAPPTTGTDSSTVEQPLTATLAGPVLDTVDGSRYTVELVVASGPLTIDAVTALDVDGAEVPVTAPQTPLTLQTGATTIDIELPVTAVSISAITLTTRLGTVSVSGLAGGGEGP